MIPSRVVNDFLHRDLKSYEWIKEKSHAQLDAALAKLDPPPSFYSPLWLHQKAGVYLGIRIPSFLYFYDMGTGKTKMVLEIFNYRQKHRGLGSVLAVVPNAANIQNWEDQVAEHLPDMKAAPLYGSSQERWEIFKKTEADIYIINYAGLYHMVTDSQPRRDNPRKSKLTINKQKMQWIYDKIDGIILDESQNIKSHTSLSYKISRSIAHQCSARYAMTGTPMGRDAQDLWSQFYAIDEGQTLGPTLGLFRAALFNSKKNYWGGYDHKLKADKKDDLHRIIRNRSIYYNETEIEQPEAVPLDRLVVFPKANREYYDRMFEEMKAAKGDVKRLEQTFIKMRQITAGFIRVREEGSTEYEDIAFPENPKLEALLDLASTLPEDKKMVVFHEFTWSGAAISKGLTEAKLDHVRLWGGNSKDHPNAIRKFKTNSTCRFMVANSKSGGTGLNLQIANYVVYYESPVSPITRQQSEKRCARSGQKAKHVYIYDIMMRGSIDYRVRAFLEQGKDLFDAVIEGKVDYKSLFDEE